MADLTVEINKLRFLNRDLTAPSTLHCRNLNTQQSQAAETLECTRKHAHSNHHFGRHFGFVFEEDSGRQITWLSWRHCFQTTSFPGSSLYLEVDRGPWEQGWFSKSFVFKMFSVHTKSQSSGFKFLRFQELFRKTRFSMDSFSGLEWTEGLTAVIKLRLQIPPA